MENMGGKWFSNKIRKNSAWLLGVHRVHQAILFETYPLHNTDLFIVLFAVYTKVPILA